MAMTKCKECGAEISTKAEACPKCGAKRKSGDVGWGAVILAGIFAFLTFAYILNQPSSEKPPPKPKMTDAECRADAECWALRHRADADWLCRPQIERLAQHDFRWTAKTISQRLRLYTTPEDNPHHIAYLGDGIEFQSGIGTWQRHKYGCIYDPGSKQVIDVRATRGRL